MTIPKTCSSRQYADIYYVALPGEQRKPYSINITRQFDQFEAVNWSTRSFKTDKLDVVNEIIAQYGSGLNEVQLAAISRWSIVNVSSIHVQNRKYPLTLLESVANDGPVIITFEEIKFLHDCLFSPLHVYSRYT